MAAAVAVATLLFYLATSHGYGYFRDELYYVACSTHLAAGYVDHPPLLEVLLCPLRAVLGDSLPALRLLPSIAAALTVLLTARLVRRLGGDRLALLVALIGVITAPLFLGLFSILTPNALEVVWWTLALLLVVRILDGGPPALWPALGLVIGLGFETKHGIVFLGVGLVAGLLLTPARRVLATRWPWLAAAIATACAAPHLAWQIANGWPTLEFLANARAMKNLARGPAAFVGEQILVMNPLAAPIWIAGLVSLWRRDDARFRAIAWAYLVVLVLVVAGGGKSYYVSGFYPTLFAAGGVAFARLTRARWLALAVPAAALALGIVMAPLAKPLLPVDRFIAYQRALGQDPRLGTDERNELGPLPQQFADQYGWPELAATVAEVYRALPPDERARACILTTNYGEAGAIDFFGPAYGLPHAISGHNSYWLWGPGTCDFATVVVVGRTADEVRPFVREVTVAAQRRCPLCMPFEDRPILVTRGTTLPPGELWTRLRRYL